MIEKTLYYALAANLVFMVPIFQRAIASRKERKKTKVYEAVNEVPLDEFAEWLSAYKGDHRVQGFKDHETNPLARKPFNCLMCFTFWSTVIGSCLIPLIFGGVVDWPVCLTAPPVAVAFNRWLESLPVKI